MIAAWWMWLVAAFVVGAIEMLVPGFVFLGFAVGAGLMAGLVAFVGPMEWPMALAIWAVLSLLAWLMMRAMFSLPGGKDKPKIWDRDINDSP